MKTNRRIWVGLSIAVVTLIGLRVLYGYLDEADGSPMHLMLAWGGHGIITRNAIQLLSKKVRKWLGGETRVLIDIYDMFPDRNWPWEGRWGGEGGFPDTGYRPDTRREWNISYYCGWDPVSLKAPPAPLTTTGTARYPIISKYPGWGKDEARYWPMGDYETPRVYFPKIIRAIQEGKFPDGIRFLGVLLHHIQDSGAFMHWMDLHKVTGAKEEFLIEIEDYKPKILGETIEDAIEVIQKRMKEMVEYQSTIVDKLRDAVKKGDTKTRNMFIKECANNCSRLTADIIYTAAYLVDFEEYSTYSSFGQCGDNPVGANLAENSSFEIDDGTNYPEGWVILRHDLDDFAPVAEWTDASLYSIYANVVRSGNHSVKLAFSGKGLQWIQRWPFSIYVKPGDEYVISGFIKTYKATGKNLIKAEFYKDDYQENGHKEGANVNGTVEWQKVEFKVKIPKNTYKMRLACFSCENPGAVWFDDVEAVKV